MKALLALALAVAFGAGVLLFPNALEPGRAERDGFSIDLLQPGTDRLASEDWYLGSSPVSVSRTGAGARVISNPRVLVELTSRSLAVVHEACYRLSFRGSSRGDMSIQVADEGLHRELGNLPVPKGTVTRPASLTFDVGDRRRISLLVRARGVATAVIGDLRLDRIHEADCHRT